MAGRLHSIAIADDQPIVRYGLEQLFSRADGMVVGAQLADGHEVLRTDFSRTSVLLLDLGMAGPDDHTLVSTIAKRFPKLRILVYSEKAVEPRKARDLTPCVAGFLSKNDSPRKVVAAIHSMIGARAVMSPHADLSKREWEVLRLIAGGKKPTDIALQLGLSIGTVTTHIHRVKRKLGVRSLGELVLYGHRHQIGQ